MSNLDYKEATIKRLAGNWDRRATVKKPELALDTLFEDGRPDYPFALTPLHRHPAAVDMDPQALRKALYLAAIAFHRYTMIIERDVVCPTFSGVLGSEFPVDKSEYLDTAVIQAAVDEQYHTLMHHNAAQVLSKSRGWGMPVGRLPIPGYARLHHQIQSLQHTGWERNLVGLAFTVVTELSIDSFLVLLGQDKEIQPLNSAIAALHWRDEKCHSSIAGEIAKSVFLALTDRQRDFFVDNMASALRSFSEQDFSLWYAIADLAEIENGHQILNECAEIPGAKRSVRDNSNVHRLWLDLNSIADGRYDELLVREEVPGVSTENLGSATLSP